MYVAKLDDGRSRELGGQIVQKSALVTADMGQLAAGPAHATRRKRGAGTQAEALALSDEQFETAQAQLASMLTEGIQKKVESMSPEKLKEDPLGSIVRAPFGPIGQLAGGDVSDAKVATAQSGSIGGAQTGEKIGKTALGAGVGGLAGGLLGGPVGAGLGLLGGGVVGAMSDVDSSSEDKLKSWLVKQKGPPPEDPTTDKQMLMSGNCRF